MNNAAERTRMNRRYILSGMTTALLGAAFFASPESASAQAGGDFSKYEAIFAREYPVAHELVVRLDRTQDLLFGQLIIEGDAVRASADTLPSPDFEFDMLNELGMIAGEGGSFDDTNLPEDGLALFNPRAAAIVQWGDEFRRGVLGVLSDRSVTDFQGRRAKLAELVAIYQSRADVALPTVPKNMDILYQHPEARDFRTGYTDLGGMIWAGHWYKLAITKPLVDLSGAELVAGLDTVQARYFAKLSYGDPPNYFPSELPLAPAIAPELGFMSPATVAILDNLSMFEEVISDVLVSPTVADAQAGVEQMVDFFLSPTLGVTTSVGFGTMALRHGIFFQGGYPLIYMEKSERNAGGHNHVGM
jgi:hypothetical protein